MPRTSSRTTPTARSCSGGSASSSPTAAAGRRSTSSARRSPFEVREGLDAIAVDDDALDDGLVVVPRESVGTAADAPDRVPPGPRRRRRSACGSSRCRRSSTRWSLGVPADRPGGRHGPYDGRSSAARSSSRPSSATRRCASSPGDAPRRPLVAVGAGVGLVARCVGLAGPRRRAVGRRGPGGDPIAFGAPRRRPAQHRQGPGLVGDPAVLAIALCWSSAIGHRRRSSRPLVYVRLTTPRVADAARARSRGDSPTAGTFGLLARTVRLVASATDFTVPPSSR